MTFTFKLVRNILHLKIKIQGYEHFYSESNVFVSNKCENSDPLCYIGIKKKKTSMTSGDLGPLIIFSSSKLRENSQDHDIDL